MNAKYLLFRPGGDYGFAQYDPATKRFSYTQNADAAHEATKEDWGEALSKGRSAGTMGAFKVQYIPAPIYVNRLEQTLARNNVIMTEGAQKIEELVESKRRTDSWLSDRKRDVGCDNNLSFDVVFEMLKGIVRHAFIHNGYQDIGFEQMTTPEKNMVVAILSSGDAPMTETVARLRRFIKD